MCSLSVSAGGENFPGDDDRVIALTHNAKVLSRKEDGRQLYVHRNRNVSRNVLYRKGARRVWA